MKYLGAILLLLIGLNSCKETAKKENVPEMDIPIVEADLAKAMLSIPATKGFEIGSGFAGTRLFGSRHNDIFVLDESWIDQLIYLDILIVYFY